MLTSVTNSLLLYGPVLETATWVAALSTNSRTVGHARVRGSFQDRKTPMTM